MQSQPLLQSFPVSVVHKSKKVRGRSVLMYSRPLLQGQAVLNKRCSDTASNFCLPIIYYLTLPVHSGLYPDNLGRGIHIQHMATVPHACIEISSPLFVQSLFFFFFFFFFFCFFFP